MKITVNIKFNSDEDKHWTQNDDYTGSVKLTRSINRHETKSIEQFLEMFKDILKLANINENQLCYLAPELDPISDYCHYDLDQCSGKTIGIKIDKNFADKYELQINHDGSCMFDYKDEDDLSE